MTGIETDLGPFPAQTLRRRDRIRVRGGGFREIVWLDRICLDETFLSLMPDAQPIQISASAFGPGIPAQSLLVSPSQGVLVPGGTGLCTARELLAAGRAQRRPETMMTWTMFACSEPVDVCAAGLWLRVDAR